MTTQLPIAKIWRATALRLQKEGIDTPLMDARLLIQHVLGVSREQLLMQEGAQMTAAQQDAFEALIARRAAREPMAHILGKREFYGREFKVTRDTLDPRPDSETLIEAVKSHLSLVISNQKTLMTNDQRPTTILDLGTGTGCLLLTLLAEMPHYRGVGVDVCNKALKVAQENATKLGLNERVAFVASRWAAGLADSSEQKPFDIIVSNPPYIPTNDIPLLEPEVALHEPSLALDGGHDGLDCYREIIACLPQLLAPQGFVVLEIGMGQEQPIEAIANEHGFAVVEIKKDLAGINRVLIMQRMRT